MKHSRLDRTRVSDLHQCNHLLSHVSPASCWPASFYSASATSIYRYCTCVIVLLYSKPKHIHHNCSWNLPLTETTEYAVRNKMLYHSLSLPHLPHFPSLCSCRSGFTIITSVFTTIIDLQSTQYITLDH